MRVVESIPPASERAAAFSSSMGPTLALASCRVAALLATRRSAQAVVDTSNVLGALLLSASSSSSPSAHVGLPAAVCSVLIVHADALAVTGSTAGASAGSSPQVGTAWREAVSLLHGVQRFASRGRNGPVLAASSSSSSSSAFSSWTGVDGAQDLALSASSSVPIGERALAYLHALEGSPDALLGRSARDRLLVHAALRCAETLAAMGYAVAARNAVTEALEALDADSGAGAGAGAGAEEAAAAEEGALPFPAALAAAPTWLFRGLLLLAQARFLRVMGKDADAAATLQLLEALPGWAEAASALAGPQQQQAPAAVPPTPLRAFAAAQLAAFRGLALVQASRLPEAVPVLEFGVRCLGRVLVTGAGGTLGAANAERVAALVSGPNPNLEAAAGFACASTAGVEDPLETLGEVLLALADAIRRGPPAGAMPPSTVALDLLHSSVRALPWLLGRPDAAFPAALAAQLEGGRDAVMASLSKRVLHGTAVRFGLLADPAAFRVAAPAATGSTGGGQ
jgi:hypothetical protein